MFVGELNLDAFRCRRPDVVVDRLSANQDKNSDILEDYRWDL